MKCCGKDIMLKMGNKKLFNDNGMFLVYLDSTNTIKEPFDQIHKMTK